MNPALKGKDEMALEAVRTTLSAVDVILDSLLDQIQEQVKRLDRERIMFPTLSGQGEALGSLMRLTVQKDTLERLRAGIPKAILEGNASGLGRIVSTH